MLLDRAIRIHPALAGPKRPGGPAQAEARKGPARGGGAGRGSWSSALLPVTRRTRIGPRESGLRGVTPEGLVVPAERGQDGFPKGEPVLAAKGVSSRMAATEGWFPKDSEGEEGGRASGLCTVFVPYCPRRIRLGRQAGAPQAPLPSSSPAAPFISTLAPSLSPGTGHLVLSGCRIHPYAAQLMLFAPGPRYSLPCTRSRHGICLQPQLCSSWPGPKAAHTPAHTAFPDRGQKLHLSGPLVPSRPMCVAPGGEGMGSLASETSPPPHQRSCVALASP